MIYKQGKDYSLDKWRAGRFTNYTIWNDKHGKPVKEFSTQWSKTARIDAIKELLKLDNQRG